MALFVFGHLFVSNEKDSVLVRIRPSPKERLSISFKPNDLKDTDSFKKNQEKYLFLGILDLLNCQA